MLLIVAVSSIVVHINLLLDQLISVRVCLETAIIRNSHLLRIIITSVRLFVHLGVLSGLHSHMVLLLLRSLS